MNQTCDPVIPPYVTRISSRAKRLQINISATRGMEVIIPKRLPRSVNIDDFIESKRNWIIKHAQHATQAQQEIVLPKQIEFPYLNENWQVEYHLSNGRTEMIVRPDQTLIILAPSFGFSPCQRLLKDWMKKRAHANLLPHLDSISQHTALAYSHSKIGAQKTFWGNCSADKTINLNMHLLFLPRELVSYVLIHELAHTIHLNHSKRFWALVEKHDPNHTEHKKQLKHLEKQLPKWILA